MKEYFVWLAKLLTLIVIFLFFVPILLIGAVAVTGSMVSQDGIATGSKAVAVVELSGTIMDAGEVLDELYRQAKNPKVKGTVLRIDSPGGAVAPSQEIYSAVKALNSRSPRKPIVASMGSVAASGGFYSALGAEKIFAQAGTMTGSIGVVLQIPNFSKVASSIGVDMVTIKSGKLKDVGNMFRAMTDEERTFLEGTANTVHQDFVKAVAEGRKKSIKEVLEFADGRVILGSQAKDLGLIDEFGDVYDAARAVFDVLGEPLAPNEIPHLHYPQHKFRELKHILAESRSILRLFSRPSMELLYLME